MPQIIDVPGQGHVEFPDGMSDADITAAIQKNLAPTIGSGGILADLASHGYPTSATTPGRGADIVSNAIKGAAASIPDMFLNAPTNIWNLGAAGVGTAATALGRPDLAPQLDAPPNLVRSLMEKTGYIKPGVEPQTTGEQYLQAGAGGAAAGAPGGLPGMVVGGVSNLAGKATSDLTGSPLAGIAASLATGYGANAAANYGAKQIALANAIKSQRQPLTDTTNEVRGAGYVISPTTTNPTTVNKIIESIGGKAAINQEVSMRNSDTTAALVRKQLGMAPDAPITQDAIDSMLFSAGAPYRDMSSLAGLPPPVVGTRLSAGGLGPVEDVFGKTPTSPDKLVEQWRAANLDKKLYWNQFSKGGDVGAYKSYQAAADKATGLENDMIAAAQNANRPEMANALANARVSIAKIHDVDRAFNQDRGEISATDLANARNRGVPLTGDLLTAAKMGNTFPKAVQNPKTIGQPGVNNLNSMLGSGGGGAIGASLGGPAGAAIGAGVGAVATPYIQGLVRQLLLSKGYQNAMGTPSYSAGLVSRLASPALSTSPADALIRALVLSQQR